MDGAHCVNWLVIGVRGDTYEYSAVYCQVYYNEVQYACNTLYFAIYYNAVELMGVIAVQNSVGRLDVSYTFSAL